MIMIKNWKNTLCIRIWSIKMAKTLYQIQCTRKSRSRKNWLQRWKTINEQCSIKKNSGQLEKQILHKAGNQRKVLFEMDIKTMLCSTKNIWHWLGSNSQNQNYFNCQQTRHVRMRILELSKAPRYEFFYIISKTNMTTKYDYYSQILTT